ncbi:DUF389 domain-containing protein [Isoptericola sp. BMS4]|uniref:DUF389 domain-containing protein n=1 Tax=Isoptericola sp. BMS4 TaxID=2527875 RepID=UPI0014217117|nr:DUF389 domain-containing protein [Isoptericola sp. BMS4]
MRLRVVCAAADSDAVVAMLDGEPGVAHVSVAAGTSRQPPGDVIEAFVAREVAEDVVQRLKERGVDRAGEIALLPVELLISRTADAAERETRGASADAVIWDELVATTGDESRLNGVYLAFLVIACLLAAVGVMTDSAVTIVGAMVVGPDFGPLAALAVAVVGRRRALARRAVLALGAGYPLAIAVTVVLVALARRAGLGPEDPLGSLDQVAFIAQVGPFSVIVALLAGAAGMLALTSAKSSALIGVFISVTTVPAAGYAAVAAVEGDWASCGRSLLQLGVNLVGIVVAGALTLRLRRHTVPTEGRARAPWQGGHGV